jgi:hypothetical protein
VFIVRQRALAIARYEAFVNGADVDEVVRGPRLVVQLS